MTVAYDAPGRRCYGAGEVPGTQALRIECLSLFPRSEDAGVCNCRTVAGSSTLSVHGECRAWDAHYDQPGRNLRNPAGDELAAFLVAEHNALSVQVVIWNRRIWSVTKPYWRTYTGPNPHIDHIHVELNWHGGRTLTRAQVRAAWNHWKGATPADPDEEEEPEVTQEQFDHMMSVGFGYIHAKLDSLAEAIRALTEAVKASKSE